MSQSLALAPAPALLSSIRQLGPRHRQAMAAHLLELSAEDRYLRFGYAASEEHIRAFIATLNFVHTTVFGVFDRRNRLLAMAQLSNTLDRSCHRCGEFGVSVSAQARGKGLGLTLFLRATQHARSAGIDRFLVHALAQNGPMLTVASKAGAQVLANGDDSQVLLLLPAADGTAREFSCADSGNRLRQLWHRLISAA